MSWPWLILVLALCIKTLVTPTQHTTYPCFEAGSRAWWLGLDLYDLAECGYDYRYSPAFAVAFTPFAMFPTRLGGTLWSLASVGLMVWGLRQLMQHVFPCPWTKSQQFVFSVLVALAAVRGLWAAQTNTTIAALIAGGAAAVIQRRWWWAAFLLTVPIYIKIWPAGAALLVLACWFRELLRPMIVANLGLLGLPFLTRSPGTVLLQYERWIAALLGPMQARHDYRDAWTIWELIHQPVSPLGYQVLQLTTAGLALGLCLWQAKQGAGPRALLTFLMGLWAAWQLSFGPGTERNTFCLIAPFISWALITSLHQRQWAWLMITAFSLTTTFSFGILERKLIDHVPWVPAALPVGVMLFGLWLILYARQGGFTRGECQDPAEGDSMVPIPFAPRLGAGSTMAFTHRHAGRASRRAEGRQDAA